MKTEAHFENISQVIQKRIKLAKYNICIAVTWLTDIDIIVCLLEKASEGLHIDIILDLNEVNLSKKNILDTMDSSGIELFFSNSNMMHNKFCLIDQRELISGSYNYSMNARNNHENILINRETELIDKFIDEFKSIKSKSERYNTLFKEDSDLMTSEEIDLDSTNIKPQSNRSLLNNFDNDELDESNPDFQKYLSFYNEVLFPKQDKSTSDDLFVDEPPRRIGLLESLTGIEQYHFELLLATYFMNNYYLGREDYISDRIGGADCFYLDFDSLIPVNILSDADRVKYSRCFQSAEKRKLLDKYLSSMDHLYLVVKYSPTTFFATNPLIESIIKHFGKTIKWVRINTITLIFKGANEIEEENWINSFIESQKFTPKINNINLFAYAKFYGIKLLIETNQEEINQHFLEVPNNYSGYNDEVDLPPFNYLDFNDEGDLLP